MVHGEVSPTLMYFLMKCFPIGDVHETTETDQIEIQTLAGFSDELYAFVNLIWPNPFVGNSFTSSFGDHSLVAVFLLRVFCRVYPLVFTNGGRPVIKQKFHVASLHNC